MMPWNERGLKLQSIKETVRSRLIKNQQWAKCKARRARQEREEARRKTEEHVRRKARWDAGDGRGAGEPLSRATSRASSRMFRPGRLYVKSPNCRS
jgi:hypothetical protein